MEDHFHFTVQTFSGLEETLADELKLMGMKNIKTGGRVVFFEGGKRDLYKANYCCRTALRVLVPIETFPANDENELYEQVKKIEWDSLFSVKETFVIEASVYNSNITHSQYLSQKTKDAIADYFREKFNERPSVDKKNPDIIIHVRLSKNECTISLDSSGEPLYKRGYRIEQGLAPLNEILAAGLIKMTGWDKISPLVDPMCGSGTFLIEAAMIAKNIPAGFLRKDFGFMHWKNFLFYENSLFEDVKDEAFAKKTSRLNTIIVGSDIDPEQLSAARINIEVARLTHEIELRLMPFDQTIPPTGDCTVILNPPYGERISPEDILTLYKEIGDYLKKKYSRCTAWILTSNEEASKNIGLHASKKIKVFNGPLECRFMKYELYQGTKKRKETPVEN